MSALISPRFSKLLALAILVVVAWLAANVSYGLISGRLGLAREIEEARQRFEAIHKRRVDIPSLQNQLAALTTSSLVRGAAIAASSDSAASTRLQQQARDAIDQIHGKLLSLNALGADRASSTVAVQVRARLDEPMVPTWIDRTENGEPRLYLEELSIAARPQPSEPALPIEISATLRARWLPVEERKP